MLSSTNKVGSSEAIIATAQKLAGTFYSMLKNGTKYVDKGQDYYEKQYHDRIVNNFKKRVDNMGFELIARDV